ncbi:MAG: 50S ribosomal protein L30 [Nanoarchaeota archaeon]
MIAVIRISGDVDLPGNIREALYRLKIRRKYSAVLIHPTQINMKLLKVLRNHVAYGTIDNETLTKLIEKRGKPLEKDKKINKDEIIEKLDKKTLSDLGLKPFFRLHPPRGGIDSKKHAGKGKGVLGDNKEKINDLIRRML